MIRRAASLLVALSLLALTLDAAPRRRASGKCCAYDETTPAGWLAANATVLTSTELTSYNGDLSRLGAMIGDSSVVGLGDTTHGTHEYYTMKLRIIDFLVREKGFDVVALEGPFSLLNRINAYVQGGPGDARALLREMRPLYYFWDAEELLAIVEWMREYNAHRGDRPAVQIAGFDVYEPYPASREVISYLYSVDPAAAVTTEVRYQCVTPATLSVRDECHNKAVQVRDTLAAREAELTSLSSAAAFEEALQNARVVEQSRNLVGYPRDNSMAQNALWIREHRGSTHKLILWGHVGHLAKASSNLAGPQPMGKTLAETIGGDYFSLGMMTAQGTFRHYNGPESLHVFANFRPLSPTAYESYFRQRGVPFLLIPLRGTLPSWLTEPATYNVAGGSGQITVNERLSPRYDAVIFIDTTTPLQAIQD